MSSTNTIWAFADVDDNLITNSRTSPVEGSAVAALDDKGKVCGWLTPKQKQFLGLLDGRVALVLTTARTSKGVSQLQLPIKGWSIASFGGVIRNADGQSEPRFRALMAAGSAAASHPRCPSSARRQWSAPPSPAAPTGPDSARRTAR